MRILGITDLRGATERMPQILELARKEHVDAVIFCGNIVGEDARIEAFRKAEAIGESPEMEQAVLDELEDAAVHAYEAFFDEMGKLDVPVMVIPGHLDAPERLYMQAALNHEVVAPNIDMIHHSFAPLPSENLVVAGFGGGLSDDLREDRFVLVYPDWEAEFAFEYLRHLEHEPVLVFHTPPRHGDLDLENGKHIGRHIVEEIIKTYRPRFAFCGSALDGQGTAMIGTTLVINPGPLLRGQYALLDTRTEEVTLGQLPEPQTI
ncbi:MAG: metallophosphoesterase family protein [Anaerolineae bacterium]|nr:metallophosphoesterase family protein [Anaerolineae bacterium]